MDLIRFVSTLGRLRKVKHLLPPTLFDGHHAACPVFIQEGAFEGIEEYFVNNEPFDGYIVFGPAVSKYIYLLDIDRKIVHSFYYFNFGFLGMWKFHRTRA